MLARVLSAATFGIEARVLHVEVDVSRGLPAFRIVGLPDASVRESRERVRSALRNSGFSLPSGIVTVNLAPADLRKAGASLDLPLAIALLSIGGPPVPIGNRLFVGELGLNGEVRPVKGALCLALAAREAGAAEIVLPLGNAAEAAAVDDIRVTPVRSLSAVVAHLRGERTIPPWREVPGGPPAPYPVDFADIRGQTIARRGLEIAAAGGHHVLLCGPPGAGKTMLARRIPTVLPSLSRPEAIAVTKIHSVAGTLCAGRGLLRTPPFRAPHNGISAAGLLGGGPRARPGEISLAHRGVLFLDELPEFRRDVLEGIRQPIEEKRISIVRVGGAATYPCDFLLVAAMNPCPCGFVGDPRRACVCDLRERRRYAKKVSGPFLDRIDLHVSVPPVPWREIEERAPAEASLPIRERVAAARARAAARAGSPGFRNADLSLSAGGPGLALDASARRLLPAVVDRLHLSVRGLHRALRVARTIADLAASEEVTGSHLAEAVSYRARGGTGGTDCLDRIGTAQ